MVAPVAAEKLARAVDLVRHGGVSARKAAEQIGVGRATLADALKGKGAAGAAVAALATGLAGPGRVPPRPVGDEPPDSAPAEGDAVALPEARRALARAHRIRESLPGNASLAERRTAEKLVQDAITTLTKCEAARELTPSEILRSPAWRRVETALVAVFDRHPAAAADLAKAMAALAAEGG